MYVLKIRTYTIKNRHSIQYVLHIKTYWMELDYKTPILTYGQNEDIGLQARKWTALVAMRELASEWRPGYRAI